MNNPLTESVGELRICDHCRLPIRDEWNMKVVNATIHADGMEPIKVTSYYHQECFDRHF